MQKENENNKVILNLIQNLQRKVVLQEKQPRQAWKIPIQERDDNTDFTGGGPGLRPSGAPLRFGLRPTYNGYGFTLIELLVVVLIIGILAAVALAQYRIAVAKSHFAPLKALTQKIADAQELYYLSNGQYGDPEELDIEMPAGNTRSDGTTYVCYSAGCCSIATTRIICYSGKVNLGYFIGYDHADSLAGYKYCLVTNTTDTTAWENKICQAETGKSVANSTSDDAGLIWYRY